MLWRFGKTRKIEIYDDGDDGTGNYDYIQSITGYTEILPNGFKVIGIVNGTSILLSSNSNGMIYTVQTREGKPAFVAISSSAELLHYNIEQGARFWTIIGAQSFPQRTPANLALQQEILRAIEQNNPGCDIQFWSDLIFMELNLMWY